MSRQAVHTTRTVRSKVRYPAAEAGGGHLVSIHDATAGTPYACFGCGAPMVARKGTKRTWHFAHKPPISECSDPDRALHETAKAMILQGFTEALTRLGEYRVGFCCGDCGTEVTWNIARPGSMIAPERTVVESTRSDLVIERPEKSPLIVEIVVTHEIEEATRAHYEQSELPVLVVRPQWDTITELAHTLIADDSININTMRCSDCRQERARAEQELAEARSWASRMLDGMNAPSAGAAEPHLRPWQRDKFGREMYPSARQAVHQNAHRLRRLGFVQSERKPWLLMFRLPERHGIVFANFGSTEEVPIWEDPSALIHWQLPRCSDTEEDALVRLVLRRCREAGVEVRVSFYDRGFDPGHPLSSAVDG